MFAKRLKEARKRKNLLQKELASLLGVSRTTVTSWENGTRVPEFETLQRIADVLEVSVDYLLGRSDNPSPTPSKTQKPLHQRRIELEEAFKELLQSDTVMFDGLPVGELDEEIIEDLELMLDHILKFLKAKKNQKNSPAGVKGVIEGYEAYACEGGNTVCCLTGF